MRSIENFHESVIFVYKNGPPTVDETKQNLKLMEIQKSNLCSSSESDKLYFSFNKRYLFWCIKRVPSNSSISRSWTSLYKKKLKLHRISKKQTKNITCEVYLECYDVFYECHLALPIHPLGLHELTANVAKLYRRWATSVAVEPYLDWSYPESEKNHNRLNFQPKRSSQFNLVKHDRSNFVIHKLCKFGHKCTFSTTLTEIK